MCSIKYRSRVCGILLLTPVAISASSKTPYYRAKAMSHVRPRAGGGSVVVNAASFEDGISPGALATVFGSDLTSVNGTIIAPGFPLPTILANVSVMVDGVPAPIYSVAFANGEDQISFQVPYDTRTGPGAVNVEVFDGPNRTPASSPTHSRKILEYSFIRRLCFGRACFGRRAGRS